MTEPDKAETFPHEVAAIHRFVRRERQARYLALLSRKGGRGKFVGSLGEFQDFDSKYVREIPPPDQRAERILALLNQMGAPESCYVISENPALDGRSLLLLNALLATVGYGAGTIVSCRAGSLAYYEGEARRRFFLVREPE